MKHAPRVVGIGGTARAASSTERLIGAVLEACAERGAETRLFGGAMLADLPHFAPDVPERTEGQRALIEAVRTCDALVIGSPGYHGGVSGLVKNAIDLLDDLRSDARVYFDGRPVGLLVTAAGWQATGVTLTALRGIVHAMRGWPTPIGIGVNISEQRPFGEDGRIAHPEIRKAVAAQAEQLVRFARAMAPAGPVTPPSPPP